jgi:mannosylglycerate hydrolase
VLMDEFLVSGETIIRDLQLGLDRAAAFGGASEVGYLPDMFGHVAQMPQLLRRAGFGHAVVWRGVPAAVDRTGFWWEAPDGSTVRAQYLPDGYGNGASLPTDAKDLVRAIARFEAQHGELLTGPLLWLNGSDHQPPQPWLGRVVAEANDQQDDYRLRVGSLASALGAAPTTGLPTWRGELRSGSRANLLMGVASNRTDVKQAAAAAERWIERYAEPLSALFLQPRDWPAPFLAEAWTAMIRNSAHDSSCACSHDEVCAAVLVRYQEARQIGEGLTERVTTRLAGLVAEAGQRLGPHPVRPGRGHPAGPRSRARHPAGAAPGR